MNNSESLTLAKSFNHLWQSLCKKHTELFELTFEEYSLMIENDSDSLIRKLQEKKALIKEIARLNQKRESLIEKMELLTKDKIDFFNIEEVIKFITINISQEEAQELNKLNNILKNLILQIKRQNYKSKKFIKKSIIFINQMKNNIINKTGCSLYKKKGNSVNIVSKTNL